jgi:hypothetical protein
MINSDYFRLVFVIVMLCVYCEVGAGSCLLFEMNYKCRRAARCLRRLVPVLLPRRLGFGPRRVDVRIVVDKVALGQVFLRVFPFFHVSVIPPLLHTHLRLHVALTRRTNGRSLRTFQNGVLFWKSGSIG